MNSCILKINLKKYNIDLLKLDNFVCEFLGKILTPTREDSYIIEVEFDDSEVEGLLISAETLAAECKKVLDKTFLSDKRKT